MDYIVPKDCSRKIAGGSLGLIIILVLVLNWATLFVPTTGDYWEAFYSFHQYAGKENTILKIFQHDPWKDGTFRPLAYFLIYLEHSAFHDSFFYYNLNNIIFYCLNILLLYRLGRLFGAQRKKAIIVTAIFSFLYSHSDIINLSFHIFITSSLSAFLFSIFLFLRFLQTGKFIRLLISIPFLLYAMFCYEVYAGWLLFFIILAFVIPSKLSRKKIAGITILAIISTYLIYIGVYCLHRSTGNPTGELPIFNLANVSLAGISVFFNLIYSTVLLNLFPPIGMPAKLSHFASLGGLLQHLRGNEDIYLQKILFYSGGTLTLILLGYGFYYLIRHKKKQTTGICLFLLALYFTAFFAITLGRSEKQPIQPIVQFRYQYIPNLLAALAVCAIWGKSIFRPKIKNALKFILPTVLILNLVCSLKTSRDIRMGLEPLNTLFEQLREGISENRITPQKQVWISRNILNYIHPICWNPGVAGKVEGCYEWVFSPDYLPCFTQNIEESSWLVETPIAILPFSPKQEEKDYKP